MKLGFYRQTFGKKKIKYKISSKSCQWEPSCSMRKDRHDEDKSFFRNLANTPKSQYSINIIFVYNCEFKFALYIYIAKYLSPIKHLNIKICQRYM